VRVEWRSDARDDALGIADYIEIDNPSAALAVYAEIHQQVAMLADHPLMGRPGRVPGTRELVINRTPYIVAYTVVDEIVTVLRVLHGARKWPPEI